MNLKCKRTMTVDLIKRSRLLLIIVLVLASAVLAAAQSNDRDHPTIRLQET